MPSSSQPADAAQRADALCAVYERSVIQAWAGQSASLAHARPANEIVEALWAGALIALAR